MTATRDFADYCCELLAGAGACTPKKMFGGWGISTGGLTIAIIANLGSGDTLWLKADDATKAQMEAASCTRFTYTSTKDGVPVTRGMNYYSAPDEAMESPDAMAPWARLALECALKARQAPAKTKVKRPATTSAAADRKR